MKPSTSVQEVWKGSNRSMKIDGKIKSSNRATLFFCACWLIWKQRNTLVFGDGFKSQEWGYWYGSRAGRGVRGAVNTYWYDAGRPVGLDCKFSAKLRV